MENIILKDITKRYGETLALDHISLEFEGGKITAVLGESGAGKTTLLNVIAALSKADEGEVLGAGRVSYIFQSAKLLPHFNVEKNIQFVLPKTEWGKIPGMLARVGLEGKEKRFPHELSGGEKQRVSIARAFLYPSDTLLLDEPFSSLDLSLKKKLLPLITELALEYQKTVVFVTHDVREAALASSRAIVLKGGRVACDLPVSAPYPRDFFTRLPEEEELERILAGE